MSTLGNHAQTITFTVITLKYAFPLKQVYLLSPKLRINGYKRLCQCQQDWLRPRRMAWRPMKSARVECNFKLLYIIFSALAIGQLEATKEKKEKQLVDWD